MDQRDTPVVHIPSGSVNKRMIFGIPIKALAIMAVVALEPWFVFKTAWGFVPCIPLWGFFRYHARKEPLFLEIWVGQLFYKNYYHP
jgi:type IV secretory pathway VirB3-like protein